MVGWPLAASVSLCIPVPESPADSGRWCFSFLCLSQVWCEYHFRLLGFCWAQPPCDLVGPPLPGCASLQTPHCRLPVHRVCLMVHSHIRLPTVHPGPTKSPFLLSAHPRPNAWSLNRDLPPGLATGSWLCSVDLLFWISSLIPL